VRKEWARLLRCGAVLCLFLETPNSVAAIPTLGRAEESLRVAAAAFGTASGAVPFGRRTHRAITHADHAVTRLFSLFIDVGLFWLWIVGSATVFLFVVAISAVADWHMLDWRRGRLLSVPDHLSHGARVFLRLARDRHTPHVARLLLVLAFLYWLVPKDVIPDDSWLPGFLDDLVITFWAAKGFMYLCPQALVTRHATAVEQRAPSCGELRPGLLDKS
jgi:uncharacterized membrane protein YkvA (DUF1232 family)